ncbi:MAG TPA: restriction endonuclease [Pirellulales bacterium]|nr:restriction endonuclease [Pirellulales bacterium]
MPKTEEYEAAIGALDWTRLRDLWLAIKRRDTPGWEPGKAFEYLVLRAFEHGGAQVTWPYSVELLSEEVEQIDGAVYYQDIRALIESKDSRANVSFAPIAKVRSQLLRRPSGTIGVLFSTSDFTPSAKLLASFALPQAILLWSGGEVEFALANENIADLLVLKHRKCIELAVPNYNVLERDVL